MDRTFLWKRKSAQIIGILWKVSKNLLALIGFIWLAGGPLLRLLTGPLFVTEVVDRSYSPDRHAVAEVEVRRGGLGTVWTTRVHLRAVGDEPWTVYQTKDSDFIPPLRWLNARTLKVGLPCGRFDYASNPDDWETEFSPRPDRLAVRFERPRNCN